MTFGVGVVPNCGGSNHFTNHHFKNQNDERPAESLNNKTDENMNKSEH